MRGVDRILSDSWATYEFRGLDFGDDRLNARFKQTTESISRRPTTSLSLSSGNWPQAKGTYRMFDNAKVTADAILMTHQNALAERLDGDPIVFAVQDTSFLNFTGHTQTTGLGRIGQRNCALWMTYVNRTEPDKSCECILEEHEWKALYCRIHHSRTPPQQPPSVRQAVRWIAQLGGFLARKGDGEPGILTICRGQETEGWIEINGRTRVRNG